MFQRVSFTKPGIDTAQALSEQLTHEPPHTGGRSPSASDFDASYAASGRDNRSRLAELFARAQKKGPTQVWLALRGPLLIQFSSLLVNFFSSVTSVQTQEQSPQFVTGRCHHRHGRNPLERR